jgi:hypothetical protein
MTGAAGMKKAVGRNMIGERLSVGDKLELLKDVVATT